ncbi:hypothetical protein [Paenibacillus massiliensis]|uniref:hypothetical protein n=1 Tax=Paenibacillus massiliensis TaxID=225917 RepID=UPI0004701156|nr:hypothetical protein [Paenibacillus massiliensis]
MNYTDNLILYENNEDLEKKAIQHINNLTTLLEMKPLSVTVLMDEKNENIMNDLNEFPLTKLFLTNETSDRNSLLGILRSFYSGRLGNNHFSTPEAHAVILFELDIIQMDFLYHLKRYSELTYHLFMKKSNYESSNLNISLDDYISTMYFNIIK